MDIRFENSKKEVRGMNTDELRESFLVENLMISDRLMSVYTHYDRMIIGGVKPVNQEVSIDNHPELKAGYFLERRELGIINISGSGVVTADGTVYRLEKLSCLYLGRGVKEVSFKSDDADDPALFYLLSAPAHAEYPARLMHKEEASPVELGDTLTANRRTIYKYIHLEGIRSCQLVMGLTVLQAGSVWNSIPPHTHTRRTEVYFYFDLAAGQRIFHFMGEPTETRSIVTDNNQAVISPPWSVHFGCGTSNYAFIWGMAGENQVYSDMDALAVTDLK
ncbi:MAG: 5-dehydro-4-deoxy-D-glucuronate isomerase [Sphingobacteriales bacterium]|nr:MAG: 5-dehydro-4-deoxy-D-glucuronate isomerase [Sphingobacteriales bacterium]